MTSDVLLFLCTLLLLGSANAAFCRWKGHSAVGGFVGGCVFAIIAIPVSLFRTKNPEKPSSPGAAVLGFICLFGAFALTGLSIAPLFRGGFDEANIKAVRDSIKAEFEKNPSVSVQSVELIRETSNKLTGYATLKIKGFEDAVQKDCTATMADDNSRFLWTCK